jgi:hypothetical protein
VTSANPQILAATVSNVMAMAAWHLEFVHPCSALKITMAKQGNSHYESKHDKTKPNKLSS